MHYVCNTYESQFESVSKFISCLSTPLGSSEDVDLRNRRHYVSKAQPACNNVRYDVTINYCELVQLDALCTVQLRMTQNP